MEQKARRLKPDLIRMEPQSSGFQRMGYTIKSNLIGIETIIDLILI
jgi:hypothetical protein